MPKVLIAESVDIKVMQQLAASSEVEFVYKPNISVAELETELAKYDGLIVRPKQVTEKAIQNAKNLKLVIRGGAGVNSIALDACRKKSVVVENTPGLNSDATAEFTFALLLQLVRRNLIAKSDAMTRAGSVENPEDYMGGELMGKKIGLIGMGNIGVRVARIAEGFGMDVMFFNRSIKKLPYEQTTDLEEFFRHPHDIISLHIPLSADTNKFINTAHFAMMKKGTILINTARPQLVDPVALKHALNTGKISSFGIDGDYDLVEPFTKIDPDQKGIITHHIADATYEAQANITKQVMIQAIAFFEKGQEINRVA